MTAVTDGEAGEGAAGPPLAGCRVVLVRTTVAANLGAAARVMKNFGLRDLTLVAPEADPADPRAHHLAPHAHDVLDGCRTVADFGDAVGDCVMVVATSARTGGRVRRQSVGSPREIIPRLLSALPGGPVALVFGPEPSGLRDDEVSRCHDLITIDTDPAAPALNLAQAVAVCLYELRTAWRDRAAAAAEPPAAVAEPPAPFADLDRAVTNLKGALEAIHFLYGPKAESVMHGLRHLVSRARPTAMEVKLLLGLARQIRWFADRHGGAAGEPERGAGDAGRPAPG